MTFSEFDKYQEHLLKQVVGMGSTKGKEYANSESRFANFDRLADRMQIPRLKVAQVFFTKHMDAIESYINHGRTYSTESIQGRIVDAITYLTLIGGMIDEDNFVKEIKNGKPEFHSVASNLDGCRCRVCNEIFQSGDVIKAWIFESGPIYQHTPICPSTKSENQQQMRDDGNDIANTLNSGSSKFSATIDTTGQSQSSSTKQK